MAWDLYCQDGSQANNRLLLLPPPLLLLLGWAVLSRLLVSAIQHISRRVSYRPQRGEFPRKGELLAHHVLQCVLLSGFLVCLFHRYLRWHGSRMYVRVSNSQYSSANVLLVQVMSFWFGSLRSLRIASELLVRNRRQKHPFCSSPSVLNVVVSWWAGVSCYVPRLCFPPGRSSSRNQFPANR